MVGPRYNRMISSEQKPAPANLYFPPTFDAQMSLCDSDAARKQKCRVFPLCLVHPAPCWPGKDIDDAGLIEPRKPGEPDGPAFYAKRVRRPRGAGRGGRG